MKRSNGTIVAFERGDVVWGVDPFKRDTRPSDTPDDVDPAGDLPPRPWLVVSDESVPYHPEQYVCLTLTSRGYHADAVPLDDDDWTEGGAPSNSAILPWAIATVRHEYLDTTGRLLDRLDTGVFDDDFDLSNGYQGHPERSVVDDATEEVVSILQATMA